MFGPSEKSVASCKGAFGERVQNQEASPARILRQSMMISLPTGRLAGNFPPCSPLLSLPPLLFHRNKIRQCFHHEPSARLRFKPSVLADPSPQAPSFPPLPLSAVLARSGGGEVKEEEEKWDRPSPRKKNPGVKEITTTTSTASCVPSSGIPCPKRRSGAGPPNELAPDPGRLGGTRRSGNIALGGHNREDCLLCAS